MSRKVSYGVTLALFMTVWWYVYVRPMDEARAAILDCMDERGEVNGDCTKSKATIATNNGNQTGQGD